MPVSALSTRFVIVVHLFSDQCLQRGRLRSATYCNFGQELSSASADLLKTMRTRSSARRRERVQQPCIQSFASLGKPEEPDVTKKTQVYSSAMKEHMGGPRTYRHELGKNSEHGGRKPIAGSCVTPADVGRLNKEPVDQKNVEERWQRFFSDPSQWWNNRSDKVNQKWSDFRHKKTGEALRVHAKSTPEWVKSQVSAMEQGSVHQNPISNWNAKLQGYQKRKQGLKVLQLFQQMQGEGVEPDPFTYVIVVNACANLAALEEGRRVHTQVIQQGFESDVYVGSSLINMYAKCGSAADAWLVFNSVRNRNVVSWNVMLAALVKHRQPQKVLKLFEQMQAEGMKPDPFTYVAVCNACAGLAVLEEGRKLHAHIIQSGHESDRFVGSSLINMYAKCGVIEDALGVFNQMSSRNVVSWNAMLAGYVKCGQGQSALDLFRQMQAAKVRPNTVTFVTIAKACGSLGKLEEGRLIHSQISQHGCGSNWFVASSLVDMYSKCGSIENAWKVFKKMPTRDVVAWNAMLSGFMKCGQGQRALELFYQMREEGAKPNSVSYRVVLNTCASLGFLEDGRRVHADIIQNGHESDMLVCNSLIDMYGKSGSMEDAWSVFNKMTSHNVVSWTALLAGYLKCEQGQKVLELFQQMQVEGVRPNCVTFLIVVNACAKLKALEEGKRVHSQVNQSGYESDLFIGSSLVGMYSNCNRIDYAWRVFKAMPTHDVVSWNAMLTGYVNCGQGMKALECFQKMQAEGVRPNSVTVTTVLCACAMLGCLEEGMRVHEQAIQLGCESELIVGNSLLNFYCKCGSMEQAWRLFCNMPTHDVVSWNSILGGYVKCQHAQKSLDLFLQMRADGVEPDLVTFVTLINACAALGSLKVGIRIHKEAVASGFESDMFLGNCLVDMYAKCGSIESAWKVFSKLSRKDIVSWNTMISGFVRCGQGQKALELYRQMQAEGVKPNSITLGTILKACASVVSLEQGKCVHDQVIQVGCESDVFVGNSLVDMYAKCGSINSAFKVFQKMATRDVVSWNVMLGGLAMHGYADEALQLFKQMHQEGVGIDEITFVSLLSACSHGGLVDEGLQYFQSMSSDHGISPTAVHYVCVVDLLGRAGRLEEAEDLIKKMPCEPLDNVSCLVGWKALLGACRKHVNLEIGERAANCVLKLDPDDGSAYAQLSNLYAAAGLWERQEEIEQMRNKSGVKKLPGFTWIEVKNQVHTFFANDRGHPQIDEIHAELDRLSAKMQETGYAPYAQVVFPDAKEENKVYQLNYHSEKLAIAYGLITTPPCTVLHIYKNLRVCEDCHTATKFIARFTGRQIVVRDANRFHHFNKDGFCSCRDYW